MTVLMEDLKQTNMRIEEAIKQGKPFRSERHRAIVNLIFTYNFLMERHRDFFKPYGITTQQFNVLRILKGQYPKAVTNSDIRERMLDKMSDISRIIDRLEKKGLVIRSDCPSDRRLVDVLISQEGLSLLMKIEVEEHQFDNLVVNLSDNEAKTFNELLDKLRG